MITRFCLIFLFGRCNKKIVFLIQWNYSYYLPISGISGQTTQQNHSIYAFQNSKYIGLYDIDEYVNIQQKIKINDFFDELVLKENIDITKISCFQIFSKFFYNPHNLPTNDTLFLQIYNCSDVHKCGREKCFVIPKNTKVFSVHIVTDGLPMYTVDEKYAFFNHYYYLNKSNRGKDSTNLEDKTILLHINSHNEIL